MNSLPPESTLPPSRTGNHNDLDEQSLDFARRATSLTALERIFCTVGFGTLIASVPIMFLLNALLGIPPNPWECAIMMPIAFTGLIGGVVVSSRRSAMMREARDTRDRRKVGILLDVYMEFYNVSGHSQADPSRPGRWRAKAVQFAGVLSFLLPQIEEEDAIFLSPRQRGVLRNVLQHSDSALVAAALRALEKIGNSEDLPLVDKLAHGSWKAAEDSSLRQRAEETSACIRTRLAEQANPTTLLRAASVPEAGPHELLRPVTSQASTTYVQQLLRPGDNEAP